ncbi:hypothetical protein ACK8HH_03665 [Gordonia sp. LUNF6]|uniref:hypothetical protein n=1 Tax=Gordonia sp. LUNF6 TaxID=3388658 RepID=UPI00399AEAD1
MKRTLTTLLGGAAALAFLAGCGSDEAASDTTSRSAQQSAAAESDSAKDRRYISELVSQGIISEIDGQLALSIGPSYIDISLARQFCDYAAEHGVTEATSKLSTFGVKKLAVAQSVYCPDVR